MAVEDERAAVGFSITLSGQLIAASMAVLAAEGAFVWYALGSRLPGTWFIISAALTASLVAASIFQAGRGITKARNAGFRGAWNLNEGRWEFNSQAILLFVALLMLAITFSLSGSSKDSALEQSVEKLQAQVALIRKESEAHLGQRASDKKQFTDGLRKISSEIEALRKALLKKQLPKR